MPLWRRCSTIGESLTDASLAAMHKLRSLVHLALWYCLDQFSGEALHELVQACPKLSRLHLMRGSYDEDDGRFQLSMRPGSPALLAIHRLLEERGGSLDDAEWE